MRVLVIDSEALDKTPWLSLLEKRSDVELLDSTRDTVDALMMLSERRYDIVIVETATAKSVQDDLLDLLRKQQKPLPSIVFVSATDETSRDPHSCVARWVLKPCSSDRCEEALREAFRKPRKSYSSGVLPALPDAERLPRTFQARVALKTRSKTIFVNPAQMSAAIAQGNYVRLHHETRTYLLRQKISLVARELHAYGFVRIHRSVLVNRAFVEELRPELTGEYTLRIKGGTEYTVSRTFKQNLRLLADSWIGNDALLSDDVTIDSGFSGPADADESTKSLSVCSADDYAAPARPKALRSEPSFPECRGS
jgi:two-component system, LytTR family, response regulator